MLRKLFQLIIILGHYQFAFAQQTQFLENFSVSNNNGSVFLSWTLTAGSTCNGIQIYRSINGTQFYEIGNIAGSCGSSSSAVRYDFTDSDPVKNSVNYYRLALGSSETSEIISLEIIDIETVGYHIRPNPVSATSKIYFDNNNELHHLILYTTAGIYCSTISSREDFFNLLATYIENGIYLFTISDSESRIKIKGKLVVQH